MISLHEILSEERVKLRSARDGQHYTTCPQCSAGRKAGNRRKRCFEPKGVELRLWNEGCLTDECSQETPLVICEGEFDACSWMVAGATHVVSVPNGAAGKPGEGVIDPIDDRQFAYLWDGGKLRGDLKAFKKIVIATDADMPGLILRDEIAIRLGRPRCWYVAYPQGCKDANDVLMRHGREALSKVLADAKPIVPDTLVSFSDISSRADAPCLSSGWVGLDPHFKIAPPQLIVVTGKPNHGKSQWALALVANLARLRGLKGAILQFEDNPERNRRDLLRYARSWANQGDCRNFGQSRGLGRSHVPRDLPARGPRRGEGLRPRVAQGRHRGGGNAPRVPLGPDRPVERGRAPLGPPGHRGDVPQSRHPPPEAPAITADSAAARHANWILRLKSTNVSSQDPRPYSQSR